jgi:hypothetical protein
MSFAPRDISLSNGMKLLNLGSHDNSRSDFRVARNAVRFYRTSVPTTFATWSTLTLVMNDPMGLLRDAVNVALAATLTTALTCDNVADLFMATLISLIRVLLEFRSQQ